MKLFRRSILAALLVGALFGAAVVPAEAVTGITTRVYSAVAVSSTTTYYSSKSDMKVLTEASYQIAWSGTPTGTFTVWVSDIDGPSETDDTDWVPLTLAIAITQPAGSASKQSVDLSALPFRWVRLKYVNASGTGTVNGYFTGKGP